MKVLATLFVETDILNKDPPLPPQCQVFQRMRAMQLARQSRNRLDRHLPPGWEAFFAALEKDSMAQVRGPGHDARMSRHGRSSIMPSESGNGR